MADEPIEKTFVMLKPDGVFRHLVGSIVQRFENKGLKLIGLKMVQLDDAIVDRLYSVHKDKYFFDRLKQFVTSGPVVAIMLSGPSAIQTVRKIVGATHGKDAEPGTIRGDYGLHQTMNLIHASDSPESVDREGHVFFKDEDLLTYDFPDQHLIYGN